MVVVGKVVVVGVEVSRSGSSNGGGSSSSSSCCCCCSSSSSAPNNTSSMEVFLLYFLFFFLESSIQLGQIDRLHTSRHPNDKAEIALLKKAAWQTHEGLVQICLVHGRNP